MVVPLAKPGIVIGSIFVITIVMGDFITVGVMGGQQIASVGKIIEVADRRTCSFRSRPPTRWSCSAIVLLMIVGADPLVDIRKEL